MKQPVANFLFIVNVLWHIVLFNLYGRWTGNYRSLWGYLSHTLLDDELGLTGKGRKEKHDKRTSN